MFGMFCCGRMMYIKLIRCGFYKGLLGWEFYILVKFNENIFIIFGSWVI